MYTSWYEEHYHEMSNAGLWFRGIGINLLPADLWDTCHYRILIVRLSTARDTEDSFTHQLLYQVGSECEGVFIDCAWLPPPGDANLFDREGIPWLIGVVTKRPAIQFDCIAISNSIVQELINIPIVLQKSNIPSKKSERMTSNEIPLIMLGGANVLFSGVLINDDPVIDVLFIGEDVTILHNIFIKCRDAKLSGITKGALLNELLCVNGIVLPDAPKNTFKPYNNFNRRHLLHNAPIFFGISSNNIASLQISDGCPNFCTFCAECWSRKPYQELNYEDYLPAALAMKVSMGLDNLELYSFNFNIHTRFKELLFSLTELFPTIGLKSQRLDGIADDPDLMSLLHVVGKSSITVGIEGISQRIRTWLQKDLSETKLHIGLQRILSTPIRELKLFFLSTGKETKEDYDEYRSLLAFISETMQGVQRHPRIIVSMTPLVRFPFTPLQFNNAPDPHAISEIMLQCERLTNAKKFEFRSSSSINEFLFSQIIVRPIDTKIWEILCEAISETGFIYYREISNRFIDTFVKKLKEHGLSIYEMLEGHHFNRLPVTLAVETSFIDSIMKNSNNFIDIGKCSGTELAEGVCLGCHACNTREQVQRNIARRQRRNIKADQLKSRIFENNRCISVSLHCSIAVQYRGIPRNNIVAEISSSIMRYNQVFAHLYRGYGGSLIYDRCDSNWIHGDDLLYLRFHEGASQKLTSTINDRLFLHYLNDSLSGKYHINSISIDVTTGNQNFLLHIDSPWIFNPSDYFIDNALKCTLIKGLNGERDYQFTKESLKRKIIKGMRVYSNENNHHVIEIVPGEKFHYPSFIQSCIQLPSDSHKFRIYTESIFY